MNERIPTGLKGRKRGTGGALLHRVKQALCTQAQPAELVKFEAASRATLSRRACARRGSPDSPIRSPRLPRAPTRPLPPPPDPTRCARPHCPATPPHDHHPPTRRNRSRLSSRPRPPSRSHRRAGRHPSPGGAETAPRSAKACRSRSVPREGGLGGMGVHFRASGFGIARGSESDLPLDPS